MPKIACKITDFSHFYYFNLLRHLLVISHNNIWSFFIIIMKLNIETSLSTFTYCCYLFFTVHTSGTCCNIQHTDSFLSPSQNIHLPVEENKASEHSAVR